LGYLSIANENAISVRVFSIFTDTTSRLNNFQSRTAHDPSARSIGLPHAGKKQFDPINIFTSIDAHARVIDNYQSIMNHNEVANPERLLKFGRAGWYSVYSSQNPASGHNFDKDAHELAVAKLLNADIDHLKAQLSQRCPPKWLLENRIRLLAVLAARLALPVGPFSAEAAELISSHLAVLIRTDQDRHFVRTSYPSEPVVAEAAAFITARLGWRHLLKALNHYVQNGVVSAGYRGELLTKILCLMAMDDTTESGGLTNPWDKTRPVKVKDFLNKFLTASDGHESFCDGLNDQILRTDGKELERFLNGYIFFNHWMLLEGKLSI
jgi:hypothetical protein